MPAQQGRLSVLHLHSWNLDPCRSFGNFMPLRDTGRIPPKFRGGGGAAEGNDITPRVPLPLASQRDLIPTRTADLKWGYVSVDDLPTGADEPLGERDRRWCIPPRFDGAASFSEGAARVRLGGVYGFIDVGNAITTPKYSDASDFCNGFAEVRVGERWGFINRRGQTAIAPRFEYASPFGRALRPFARAENGDMLTPWGIT